MVAYALKQMAPTTSKIKAARATVMAKRRCGRSSSAEAPLTSHGMITKTCGGTLDTQVPLFCGSARKKCKYSLESKIA